MMDCYIEDTWKKGEISYKYAEQHCTLQKSCEGCSYWKEAGDDD